MRDLRRYPGWLHGELLNWSRWCWQGAYPHPLPKNHCGSIEWAYRAKGENSDEDARPIPPFERNAQIVDRVWRALPEAPKLVLKVEYPARYDYPFEFGRVGVARRLRMRLTDYEDALCVAIGKVWDELER